MYFGVSAIFIEFHLEPRLPGQVHLDLISVLPGTVPLVEDHVEIVGFKPQALPYEYYLVKSPEVPDVNPLNPKYRLMVNTWSKLPLPVANAIGPFLARSLG